MLLDNTVRTKTHSHSRSEDDQSETQTTHRISKRVTIVCHGRGSRQ
jgi:hypothetical protein